MMRRILLLMCCFLLATAAVASESTTEELIAKAARAGGGEKAKLECEIAEKLVERANQQFTDGDATKGQQTVLDVVQHATFAADAAISSHRRLKQTEISLRITSRHLEDIRQTLALDDRKPVGEAINRIEDLRRKLLDAIFGVKKKD